MESALSEVCSEFLGWRREFIRCWGAPGGVIMPLRGILPHYAWKFREFDELGPHEHQVLTLQEDFAVSRGTSASRNPNSQFFVIIMIIFIPCRTRSMLLGLCRKSLELELHLTLRASPAAYLHAIPTH